MDISLRKTAVLALNQLILNLKTAKEITFEERRQLLNDHLISLILKGINSSNEICRMEFIHCLTLLINTFSDDPHLACLKTLNEAASEENGDNFFENVMHIQVHRRQRAFYRLCEQLANFKVIFFLNFFLK